MADPIVDGLTKKLTIAEETLAAAQSALDKASVDFDLADSAWKKARDRRDYIQGAITQYARFTEAAAKV